MYEELNTRLHGLRDFHLACWVPAAEVAPPPAGRHVTLSPRECENMLLKGEALPDDVVLEGLFLRLQGGFYATHFSTFGGPLRLKLEFHLVGTPEDLQRILASGKIIDALQMHHRPDDGGHLRRGAPG